MDDRKDWGSSLQGELARAYSPFFVVGYKEVRNFVKLKSLLDVVLKREMKWGSLQRIGIEKQN